MLTVSTEPSALVVDPHISPFNLAPAVRLTDLDAEAVAALAVRYGGDWSAADLAQLRALVGGHPLLVRLALYATARDGSTPAEILSAATSESGVLAQHLRRVERSLAALPDLQAGARALLEGRIDVGLRTLYALEAAGVAQCTDGRWALRYRAYETWLGSHL